MSQPFQPLHHAVRQLLTTVTETTTAAGHLTAGLINVTARMGANGYSLVDATYVGSETVAFVLEFTDTHLVGVQAPVALNWHVQVGADFPGFMDYDQPVHDLTGVQLEDVLRRSETAEDTLRGLIDEVFHR